MTDELPTAFSAAEAAILAGVLNDIIPPASDGRLPGAGELDLAAAIDAALRPTPELRAMIVAGLAALDDLAQRRDAAGFAALPHPRQAALLGELAAGQDALPPVLILHAYAAYYQHPRVVAALGHEPRPPHPLGYPMAPSDLAALLEPVRRRGKRYRDAG